MKSSEILQKALHQINLHDNGYGICIYIARVRADKPKGCSKPNGCSKPHTEIYKETLKVNRDMLLNRVSDSLHEYLYVSSWLARVANVPYQEITRGNLSKYRKRWLKELIKEYKSKKD